MVKSDWIFGVVMVLVCVAGIALVHFDKQLLIERQQALEAIVSQNQEAIEKHFEIVRTNQEIVKSNQAVLQSNQEAITDIYNELATKMDR